MNSPSISVLKVWPHLLASRAGVLGLRSLGNNDPTTAFAQLNLHALRHTTRMIAIEMSFKGEDGRNYDSHDN